MDGGRRGGKCGGIVFGKVDIGSSKGKLGEELISMLQSTTYFEAEGEEKKKPRGKKN